MERCPHKWTVRYVVNGVQREKSFADEMDAGKRVRYGTGLRKARDFQLELTRGKRAQGSTYVDPKAGAELFGPAAEAFIMSGRCTRWKARGSCTCRATGPTSGRCSRSARWLR